MIKAGYMISITSWENDADAYNTITTTGLTLDEVKLIKLVACATGRFSKEDYKVACEKLKQYFLDGNKFLGWEIDEDCDEGDLFSDFKYEFVVGASATDGLTRYVSDIKIYLVPRDLENLYDTLD